MKIFILKKSIKKDFVENISFMFYNVCKEGEGMNWTTEQESAIKKHGNNILVSAAAGSGKTTVLIARIINKIINEKVDIDKLLIATFTNAAASEMRERLLKAIYDELEKKPNDENLQRQIILLNHAHISTIHSFCLNVIRNNFYEIGISSNFRVADTSEIEIMKQEVMEEIFEDKYEKEDVDFLNLLDKYTTYKDDQPLKDLMFELYDFILTVPDPIKWLEDSISKFNINVNDFSETQWGRLILDNTREKVEDCILSLETASKIVENSVDLADFNRILNQDLVDLKTINFDNWNSAYKKINYKSENWERWPSRSKLGELEKELKESAKKIRDEVKDIFNKEICKLFFCDSKESISDLKEMYDSLNSIKSIILEFDEKFKKKKNEKNILDFSDIEHIALKLLVDEDGNKTEVAKKYNFEEILVDEYQDISLIQETILNSVSNGENIFMVGDVKQSIYRFRQARPDLFIDKYESYKLIDNTDDGELTEKTKIQLYKNFRSREGVIDLTNLIFKNIMSKKLGEINYDESEYLNKAAKFEEPTIDCETEVIVIDNQDDEENQEKEIVDNVTLEARMVARKIKDLINKGFKYKDIAIILRSVNTIAPIIEKELMNYGIPVFSDVSSEYLETIEIDTILSLLKIIDNPLQDIPLVTVLRSPIGGFTDNELIEMRAKKTDMPYYKSIIEFINDKENVNEELIKKAQYFIDMLNRFQQLINKLPLDELIWKIYSDTGYYYYVRLMPNGKLRQANLRKLFEKAKDYEKISFKGLFNFISFIEKVASKSSNMSEAKIIGENEDVVRLMSIHKSKGLEFKIVFICGAGKQFNLRDLSKRIVYDQDLGIGVNYIKDGIEFSTLSKEAIKLKMRNEAISEEMRVFYVALTRAKEKLYIIATDKDAWNVLEKKEIELNKYKSKNTNEKIDSKLIGKYVRYLDWIELVYKFNSKPNMKLEVINKANIPVLEIENKEKASIYEVINTTQINDSKYDEIDKLLKWKYPYNEAEDIPTKTSVTALKQDSVTEKHVEKKEPEFISNKNKELTSMQKGTLIHLALQKLNDENVEDLIKNITVSEIERKELIRQKHVLENYIKSNLYAMIKEAKEIHKETPFYMNIPYKNTNKMVLVQGVIDLFFVDKNNNVVLVDYKTDRNVDENELIKRYEYQLELYKKALEMALNKAVDRVCIYSTYLNKLIELK